MTIEQPVVIKEYSNVYFVYKPPQWNCTTDHGYTELLKQKIPHLILSWIKENLKKDDDVNKLDYGYGLMNRLDLETSGVIIVAKNLKSYLKYRQNINDHIKTTKIYIALVEGVIEHEFGIITLPLFHDKQKRVTLVDEKRGKFSYTEYIKLQTLEYQDQKFTLLLVKIKTGRTHQIRVHLKSIGHKILCDKKYETDKKTLDKQCKLSQRLFLHASYYKIEDDVDGYVRMSQDLDNTLKKLKLVKKYMEYQNAIDILKSNIITNQFLKFRTNDEI